MAISFCSLGKQWKLYHGISFLAIILEKNKTKQKHLLSIFFFLSFHKRCHQPHWYYCNVTDKIFIRKNIICKSQTCSSESKNIFSALHIVYCQPAAYLKGLLECRAVFCHEHVLLASCSICIFNINVNIRGYFLLLQNLWSGIIVTITVDRRLRLQRFGFYTLICK